MFRWLVIIFCLVMPNTWAADSSSPGGKGSFNMANECIETGRNLVPQVCADITFHYELSAFMGEPLVHYGLMWRLRSLTIQGGAVFGNDEVRNLFGAAADRIGLMLQGTAEIRQKNAKPLAIPNTTVFDNRMGYLVVDIDSGVATRAGKMSWNIAGSPDWSKFLMQPGGGECVNGAGDVFNGTNVGKRDFVSSVIAKEVMKAGDLELSGRQICRRGTLVEGLENLEAVISKICQPKGVTKRSAEKPYAWCPDTVMPASGSIQKPDKEVISPTNTGNSWKRDDTESKSQNDAKQKVSQVQNFEKVERQCKADWGRIGACYASQGCQPKSDDEIRQCEIKACGNPPPKTVCDKPLDCRSTKELEAKLDYCERHPDDSSAGCRNGNYRYVCWSKTVCNGNTVPNPRYQEWESCAQRSNNCRVNESCTSRCNPNQYANQADCVDKISGRAKSADGDGKPSKRLDASPIKSTNDDQAPEDIDRQVAAATNEKRLAQQRALDDSWRLEQENRINAMKVEHQKRLIHWCTAEPSRQSSCACGSVLPSKTYSPNKGWAAGCSK